MRSQEAEQVVATSSEPAQWDGSDDSRACRSRIDDLTVLERSDGSWAVRLLFHQGANRMGIDCGDLEVAYAGCTPAGLALGLRLFIVEEPHGERFGTTTDEVGRRWLVQENQLAAPASATGMLPDWGAWLRHVPDRVPPPDRLRSGPRGRPDSAVRCGRRSTRSMTRCELAA